jgi:membrane protein YdbS with pleckstrin-like domain
MLGITTNSLGTGESAQKMKPWVHPQERRTRIYWSIQIAVGVVAMIGIPILLLREPTADHVVISVAVVLIGIVALIFSIRELRKLRHEYRHEEEGEDTPTGPG